MFETILFSRSILLCRKLGKWGKENLIPLGNKTGFLFNRKNRFGSVLVVQSTRKGTKGILVCKDPLFGYDYMNDMY